MAVLGHALIYHFPQYYKYFSHDSFTYAGIYHHNHNHLMDRYDGMDGEVDDVIAALQDLGLLKQS